ncbi:MAG: hypothetical protein ACYCPP_03655 [Nitrososphaerales archaeon]
MELEGISLDGINSLIQTTLTTIRNTSDPSAKAQLQSMRGRLADMRVALVELDNIEVKHSHGDITFDAYADRRKKLVRDFLNAKDQIVDVVVPDLADAAPSSETRSKLLAFKSFLKDNKGFIITGAQFLLEVGKAFAGHPS